MSVITATYNAAPFIEAMLRSALDQTLRDLELIVIDDGSKDATAEVVARLSKQDSRVRLIRQNNRGLAATRNRGVLEARGALVGFLDHDDLWHPKKLALQAAALDAEPVAAVASCYSALLASATFARGGATAVTPTATFTPRCSSGTWFPAAAACSFGVRRCAR